MERISRGVKQSEKNERFRVNCDESEKDKIIRIGENQCNREEKL